MLIPSAASACYANSFARHWFSEISVVRSDYQPLSLPLFHNPGRYSVSRLARRSVRIFIALDTPLDVIHHNIRSDENNILVIRRPDAFFVLHLVTFISVMFLKLFPILPPVAPDSNEVNIFCDERGECLHIVPIPRVLPLESDALYGFLVFSISLRLCRHRQG
jgi:hypothetical protein